jgi:hypothetical protein
MPAKRTLSLTAKQRIELERLRDNAPKPYLRERSSALLKIADGMPVAHVATTGLLKRRRAERVGNWLDRYESEGISGLYIRSGRGRKPSFFPSE